MVPLVKSHLLPQMQTVQPLLEQKHVFNLVNSVPLLELIRQDLNRDAALVSYVEKVFHRLTLPLGLVLLKLLTTPVMSCTLV